MAYVGPFPLRVEQGGTGEITLLPNAVLVGENADDIGVTNVGTNGQLLIGATGNKPLFASLTSTGGTIVFTSGMNSLNLEAASGTGTINRIDGDTSFAVGPTMTLKVNSFLGNYGTSQFTGNGVNDIGFAFSTLANNTGLGLNSLINITTGNGNVALGDNASNLMQDGTNNTCIGFGSGQFLTSGSENAMLGFGSGGNIITGSNNVLVGFFTGQQLMGAESDNIYFNNTGTFGESNTLRIGAATGTGTAELNQAFIHGIDGVNVGSVANVVTMDSDQLGTAIITAGAGITVTPGANAITIASTVVGGIQTINGNVGSVTGTTVTLTTGAANANGTVLFTGVGTTMTMTYEDGTGNIGLGGNALKNATVTSSSNIALGTNVFRDAAFAGSNNIGIGISTGDVMTTGSNNTLIGGISGQDMTSASFNVALGFNTLNNLITGSRNIVIGESSGNSYTTSESSNIIVGWQTPGTVGESNVLRIGKATGTGAGEQNKAIIHGIDGINVGSVAKVVTMASDQLGTATITAGSGISVTPGANTITIANTATAGASTFHTGSGDATVSAGAITIAGGNNISTSGSGSTVTVAVSGTTNHTIQVGNASGSLTSLAAATNGQIPIGSTGSDPVIAAITAGSGISVTNGAGSITIATTGSGFAWSEVTGTSQAMAVNNGYIANNGSLVTLTLPSTVALGDVVRVTGKGAGGWRIAQNSGQTIYFGTSTSTTGTGGHIDSTATRDGVELVCITANNDWNVLSAQGNLSVT